MILKLKDLKIHYISTYRLTSHILFKALKPKYAYVSLRRNLNIIAKLYHMDTHVLNEYLEELLEDSIFNRHIIHAYKIMRKMGRLDFGQLACLPELYVIIRSLAPDIVVETGVASGLGSAFILNALNKNDKGSLYSIDLPLTAINYEDSIFVNLPPSETSGWAVPSWLRRRWILILGNSLTELPKLLPRLGVIDVFIHDSRHTYKTMINEYRIVWPYLKNGGLLISDDITRNDAFFDFQEQLKENDIT